MAETEPASNPSLPILGLNQIIALLHNQLEAYK